MRSGSDSSESGQVDENCRTKLALLRVVVRERLLSFVCCALRCRESESCVRGGSLLLPCNQRKLSMRAISARFATSVRCLSIFRSALGLLIVLEVADRWPTLEWLYSDVGTLPRSSVMPEQQGEGWLVWLACAHAWNGTVLWVQFLSIVQIIAAACLACGVYPRASSLAVWWLHCSTCLRNGALVYILDRYMHLLLLYSACLPAPSIIWSSAALADGSRPRDATSFRLPLYASIPSFAACVLAAQLVLIYADAGLAKALDPARAWSLSAPVAALDTYMRHTAAAQAARRMLGGVGLRIGGLATVGIEVVAPTLAFLVPNQSARRLFIALVCGMHVGIALCMRNTFLLSSAAIIAWIPFVDGPAPLGFRCDPWHHTSHLRAPSLLLGCMVLLSAHHQWAGLGGTGCEGRTGSDALRTLVLHQRWNVFSSAESYVVWEIAPARLSDGTVVDIWRETDEVAWSVPTGDEPTRRRGRWRAWPYTSPIATGPHTAPAYWGGLCDMWARYDTKNRTVIGYHFYMMQADAVPMEHQVDDEDYGEVRKRLITKFNCAARASYLRAVAATSSAQDHALEDVGRNVPVSV